MRVLVCVILILYCLSTSEAVRNVRLIDHRSYIISVIQKTVNHVEEKQWCNLKVDDINLDIDEDVFGVHYTGTIQYANGFVISIQSMDIIEHTIQQLWPANTDGFSVQAQATLRLIDVAVGYDILANLSHGLERTTGVIVYPLMQFQFFVAKNLYTDAITARVVGTLTSTNNRMRVLPVNDANKVFSALYNWNITDAVIEWGTDIFAPVALDVALNEVEFPTICYKCST